MTSRRFLELLGSSAAVMVASCVFSPALFGQGPALDAPMPVAQTVFPAAVAVPMPSAAAAVSPVVTAPPARTSERHNFWDKKNCLLFAASAAASGADFAVTRANLQSGGQELNPMVRVFGRSTPGLALNFGSEAAGVVGLSYLFHKTGHHKIERAVSLFNIGGSAAAVGYGLAHR